MNDTERFADESEHRLNQITRALSILGINADTLFGRIRDDLSRGLHKEARQHLNFVNEILKEVNFGWTSVEDDLPKPETSVLVLDRMKAQSQAWHDGVAHWWSEMTENEMSVTHWRRLHPLPISLTK